MVGLSSKMYDYCTVGETNGGGLGHRNISDALGPHGCHERGKSVDFHDHGGGRTCVGGRRLGGGGNRQCSSASLVSGSGGNSTIAKRHASWLDSFRHMSCERSSSRFSFRKASKASSRPSRSTRRQAPILSTDSNSEGVCFLSLFGGDIARQLRSRRSCRFLDYKYWTYLLYP